MGTCEESNGSCVSTHPVLVCGNLFHFCPNLPNYPPNFTDTHRTLKQEHVMAVKGRVQKREKYGLLLSPPRPPPPRYGFFPEKN